MALGLGLAAAYALRAPGHWGGEPLDAFFGRWVYGATATIGMILCAWRAIRVRQDRAVWSLIAFAFVLQVAGNTVYTVLYGASDAPPVPSAADALWIAFYVPMAAALALRVRAAGGAHVVVLDVLIAIGALGAISAAFVFDAILAGTTGSVPALVTTLSYPVADLVLAALVLHLAAASGWRLGRATALMATLFLLWAVTDTIYAYQTAHGTYVAADVLDMGWVGPVRAVRDRGVDAPGPRRRPADPGPARTVGARGLRDPRPRNGRLRGYGGGHSRVAGSCRRRVGVRDRSLRRDVPQLSDRVAGDRVRGDDRCADRPWKPPLAERRPRGGLWNRRDALLLLFDLNGFKSYNDAFGHPAGDALLVRLGKCLRIAVGDAGIAYRMGGDEFCVLLGAGASERTVSAAGAALCEHGVGFAITASLGRAALPAEAANAAEALATADQRMYRHKRSARGRPASRRRTHFCAC